MTSKALARMAAVAAVVLVTTAIGTSATIAVEQSVATSPVPDAAADTLNTGRPLSRTQLLEFLGLPGAPRFQPDIVVAETIIRRDQPMRGRTCDGSRTCAFGVLERPGVDGGEPVVKARPSVVGRFPADDSALEGTFIFASSRVNTRLIDALAMPTGSYTVPLEPAAMDLAEALPIGSVIAVEGWLSQVGQEADCDASPEDTEGSPSTSPSAPCPVGWLTPEPVAGLGVDAEPPAGQTAIRVQPLAGEGSRAEPGTYLLRSHGNPDPEAQPAIGWSVVGRLDPIALPSTSGSVELPPGAVPAGLDWEPVPDAHPPLDGSGIRSVAWSGGFASIQTSRDGVLTAWRSADGQTWERAPLPQAIKRAGSLLAHRDGLVMVADQRSDNSGSAAFGVWRSANGVHWTRAGALRLDTPPRYKDDRRELLGPWSLDGRLVLLATYTTEPCCGSSPTIFLAARKGSTDRKSPAYRTTAWISRGGERWTERRTRGLNGADGGAGEQFGYLLAPLDGEVLASLDRSGSLGRSSDGIRWRKNVPLPESYDDTSPAIVARTPTGFVLAGESFDRGPGDGNWLTIWRGTEAGDWSRVFDHGQRSPDSVAVSGSTVIVAGDQLDLDTMDDDEPVYLPWILVSTDGGTTWDESLSWTGTVPMCTNELTAHGGAVVLTFGCAPPGMATTYLVDLGS